MKIPYYQVNAFTRELFRGNPAGVCVLKDWLADWQMQAIATEYSLSETAFFVRQGNRYKLRWFTPQVEIDLCGHATLASAFVIFNYLDQTASLIEFETKSGLLKVTLKDGGLISMDFPARKAAACPTPEKLVNGLKASPKETYLARDYLAVFESEDEIKTMQPDMDILKKLDCLGIIVTARGARSDFVSRFFAPKVGIPEDPVTGSAHCTLIPYWSERMGKKKLHALQLSERGGELFCEDMGGRVSIAGYAVVYIEGIINI